MESKAIMALSSIRKSAVFYRLARSFSSASSSIGVEVNDKNGVATVTFQKPPVNSMNLEFLTEFKQLLSDLEKNKSRGAIITSSLKVFCAGLDILEMYKPDPARVKKFWITLQDVWQLLYGSSYPTVAVINGPAPAGGCLLSLCCEYRIMVPRAFIGLNETQLGLIAPTWFVRSMEHTVGKRQTEMAVTSGTLFSTEEAFNVGMIDEIVQSKEEGLIRAQAFIDRFANISPRARSLSKKMVRGEALRLMSKERDEDLQLFLNNVQDESVQKGLGLYLESLKKKQSAK